MPPDSYKSSSFYLDDLPTEWPPETSLSRKIIWNDERLPNTHGSRMKVLRWTMKEWSKNYNYPMDSAEGREFIKNEEWVLNMIDEVIPDNGKNSMDDDQILIANYLFKKYGGYRNGMNFTK